jgi:hypothetical protein
VPKKSVTKPERTPPPNNPSKDFDPVLTIIINLNL